MNSHYYIPGWQGACCWPYLLPPLVTPAYLDLRCQLSCPPKPTCRPEPSCPPKPPCRPEPLCAPQLICRPEPTCPPEPQSRCNCCRRRRACCRCYCICCR